MNTTDYSPTALRSRMIQLALRLAGDAERPLLLVPGPFDLAALRVGRDMAAAQGQATKLGTFTWLAGSRLTGTWITFRRTGDGVALSYRDAMSRTKPGALADEHPPLHSGLVLEPATEEDLQQLSPEDFETLEVGSPEDLEIRRMLGLDLPPALSPSKAPKVKTPRKRSKRATALEEALGHPAGDSTLR